MGVVHRDLAVVEFLGAIIHLSHRLHDARVHRHRDGERLEGRSQLVHPKRRAVEARFGGSLAGDIGIETGQRSHRQHFAGVNVHHHARRADRRKLGHRGIELMLERLLDLARDRQSERLPARCRVGQSLVERPLDSGGAMAVDVGEAQHMRGQAGLRIEAVGGPLQCHARLAQRIDRLDQLRRSAAAQVEKGFARADHGEIARLVLFGHQLRQVARQFQLVADDLRWVERDAPHVDRACQRLAVTIDDIAARRDQRADHPAPARMIAERGQPQQAAHDQRDDHAIDDQAEHQPLVENRENLPTLSDQAEPLGPGDESGRRCVHQWLALSLVVPLLTG